MRPREDIEKNSGYGEREDGELILEVLLDIRDLLSPVENLIKIPEGTFQIKPKKKESDIDETK